MKQIFKFSLLLFVLLWCITLTAQKVLNPIGEVAPNKGAGIQNLTEAQWDVLLMFGTVTLSGAAGNAGCEWDGTYFYSTRWASNLIHKYNSTGTALVEQFSISGVTGLRDLAYDGTYMYGGAAANTIYQMDFVTKTLVGTIPSPVAVRYIAYDPGSDAFWVGTWDTPPTLVSRTGTTLATITTGLTSQYGACYDQYSTGAPTIWVFDQGGSGAVLYQYDIATGTPTGVTHDVVPDMPVAGGIAGGLFSMTDFASGLFTIGGLYQSSDVFGNDEIFVYEVINIQPCIPAASNPNPANGATDVDIDADLSWTNDAGANTIELIFNGTSVYSGTPITSWDPGTLDYFTTYTWKVTEYTDTCNISSSWSFKTEQDPNITFVTDYFYPQSANYWTGTTDGSNKTDVSEVRGLNLEDGWFMYDIASIPDDAVIDSIRFYGYVNNTYYPYWSATPLPGLNPLTATASELKTAIEANSAQGVAYVYANESSSFATGWHNYFMETTANADMEAALAQGWFAMGMDSRDNSTSYWINFDGWNQTNIPYLKVSYHYSGGSSYFIEDFESFTVPGQVACQDPINWTTWSNLPCDPVEDAQVSTNYAYSGSKSGVIVQNNDLVRLLGDQTSGKWYMSFWMYIPSGKAGYFNTLAVFAGGSSDWGMECYFDVGGGGRLTGVPGAPIAFNYSYNTWHSVEVIVDLDLDQAQFLFDQSVISSWQWTQGGTVTDQLAANDLFGATVNDEMYFDDYWFGDHSVVPVELTSFAGSVNDGNVTLTWATATETNNQGFEVQRSNGSEFTTLGFVEGHGTTTEMQFYTFTDRNVMAGTYTYRLKQIDYDGTYEYFTTEVDVSAPRSFDLGQNYPNPFNPSTKINFSLAVDSKVTLKIFDVLGQEVMTVVNSTLEAGAYTVNINASTLNSGVYFYRIEAAGVDGTNYNNVKKMILTK